jgi:hypothetical protein
LSGVKGLIGTGHEAAAVKIRTGGPDAFGMAELCEPLWNPEASRLHLVHVDHTSLKNRDHRTGHMTAFRMQKESFITGQRYLPDTAN